MIPKTIPPAEKYQGKYKDPERDTLPVRSKELKVRLRSRLGSRHTNERTRVVVPAASRQKSKKDQASMRRLDIILRRTCDESERLI